MKTPEEWCDTENKQVWLEPDFIRSVQSDARADLEAENKALRERLEKTDMAVAILRDALKKRDNCENCGGKGFDYVEIDGEAEPSPCECSHWADLVIESTATIDGITRIGEGWIPPCEASALRERAESAEASFKERDLQMRAALDETESMFQRTQRAETENVELRERAEKAEASLKVYDDELSGAASGATMEFIRRLKSDKEKAEAACAEMRQQIEKLAHAVAYDPYTTDERCATNAMDLPLVRKAMRFLSASNCGQPLLDRMRAMEEILGAIPHRSMHGFYSADKSPDCTTDCHACQWEALKEATA